MTKATSPKPKKLKITLISISLFAAVASIWWFYPLMLGVYIGTEVVGRGEFGDSFGALNTLFSGLAFTGIIISIFIQSNELELTRKVVVETQKETRAQGEQFKLQTEVMDRQLFEGTFFQMLKLHNDLVNSIAITVPSKKEFKGREAISILKTMLNRKIRKIEEESFSWLQAEFQDFINKKGGQIAPYLMNVHQILKYINNSDQSKEKKETYAHLFRAQFSTDELEFVFWYSLGLQTEEDYKLLIEKFSFFSYLIAASDIIYRHVKCFEMSAFKENITVLLLFDEDDLNAVNRGKTG